MGFTEGLLIGVLIGMVVGWNVFPQPEIVRRAYKWTLQKIGTWISTFLVVFCLIASGCSFASHSVGDIGYAKERAMAEIAIASVAAQVAPEPAPSPKVGDKCRDCNDPPGACGVGKTGDGRVCDKCLTCNGDGIIDQEDISGGSVVDKTPVSVPKEVILHMTNSTKFGWPSEWYKNRYKEFADAGWSPRLVLEPDSATGVAYFDVVAPDGQVYQFFEPIELEDVRHLETR